MNNLTLILAIILSLLGVFVQSLFGLNFALTQLSFLLLSLLIYLLIRKTDVDLVIKLAPLLTGLGILLLILLFIVGEPIRGARRWFVLFGFNLQPSVVFLPFFILFVSTRLYLLKNRRFQDLLSFLTIIMIPVLLVFKQPDLGTAVVLLVSLGAVTYNSGFAIMHYLKLLLIALPAILVFSRFLQAYQLQRLVSFLNPQYDPSGINYNSLQSEIAIGSGFIFGKGFHSASQSKLLFLPEAHTDFAFATFVEAFGLLGASLVLGLLFYLLLTLLKQSQQQKYSPVYRYYTFGVLGFLFIQTVFNIGMNLRLLPVVGVPLPFISYGGSALLSNFILLSLGAKLRDLG